MSSSVIDYKTIFLRNSKVKIKGLVSAAKYNGLVGIVIGYKESESGMRIKIQLIDKIDGDITKLDVQPKNLDFYCDGWDKEPNIHYSISRRKIIENINKRLLINDLVLLERIGSPSMSGIVFRATYDDIPVAIKFFPFDPEEVKITEYFGTIPFKKNINEPFLLNFGSGEVNKDSVYKLFDKGKILELIHGSEAAISIHTERNDNFNTFHKFNLSYVINELAVMDFKQVLIKLRSEKSKLSDFAMHTFPRIFSPSTTDLSAKSFRSTIMCNSLGVLRRFHLNGYIHGDPHPGNFMFLNDGTIIIHDYDKSKPIDNSNPLTSETNDLSNFKIAWDSWGSIESHELAELIAKKSSKGGTYSRKPKSRKYKKPKVKKIYRKTRR